MLIDGKKVADQILIELQEKVNQLSGRPPGLAFVLVGNDPASHLYVEKKKAACDQGGHSISRHSNGRKCQTRSTHCSN